MEGAGSGEEARGRNGYPADVVEYEFYWPDSTEWSCYLGRGGALKQAHGEANTKIRCYVISELFFPACLPASKEKRSYTHG